MSWEDILLFQTQPKFYVSSGNFCWVGLAFDPASAVTRAIGHVGGPQAVLNNYKLGKYFHVSQRGFNRHATDTRIPLKGFILPNEESNQTS